MKPPAVDLYDPGKLAETQDLLVGQVADGHLAVEGDQVVFTHGEHFDVLHHHHLVVVLVEHRIVQDVCNQTYITTIYFIFTKCH